MLDNQTHSIEMYKFNKQMNMNTMCDSAKLTHKYEFARFDILHQMYTKFDSRYFVTCNVRKHHDRVNCKFWLKQKAIVGEDIITDFDICLRCDIPNEIEKIKFFKNNKKLIPITIDKWEDDMFIYFDLVVATNLISINDTIIKNIECSVCYDINKSYYIKCPYTCNHNEICTDCNTKIFETSKKCPICRAD